MRPFTKLLWLTGAVLDFVLLVVFMIGGAFAEFGGGRWMPAYLGLPGAIVLTGTLAATFRRAFPDRWP